MNTKKYGDEDDLRMRCVGRSLMEVLTETEIKPQPFLVTSGLTLLGGKTK